MNNNLRPEPTPMVIGTGSHRSVYFRMLISFLILTIIVCGCKMYFKTTTDQFTSVQKEQSLERGKNLTFNICSGCHYEHSMDRFIGKSLNDLPKIAGHLYSANLTHSKTNGVPPRYSDAELFYLLKTGIGRDGWFRPYMMRPMMADDDINDVIVYLRSADKPLQAVDTTVGKTHINFIGKIGLRIASKPQPYNKGVAQPDEKDKVTYGKYLIGVIGCYHCHSKKVLGLNYLDPEKSKGYLTGGIKLKDPKNKKLRGPNLTPDSTTGIGYFSLEDFTKAVKEGITPSGEKLSPPMGKFVNLTDQQVEALYSYLRSIKPVKHKVKGQKR